MRSPTDRRAIDPWLVLLAALLPSLYYLVDLPNYGFLPFNDYYGVIHELTTEDGFRTDLKSWATVRSNEHRVTVPALLYLANYWVTKGSNHGHVVITLLMMFAALFLLLRWLRQTTPESLTARATRSFQTILALTLSLLLFNPVQSHNVALGFSGVMWLTSNALAIAALTLLTGPPETRGRGWMVAGFGLLGALTYSTNLMLWPALALGCLLLRVPRRRWLPILSAAILVYAFYFGTYETPGNSPEFESNVATVVAFACAYLGSLFSRDPAVAIAVGSLGLASWAGVWTQYFRQRRGGRVEIRGLVPWMLLSLYALGNAFGTAIGRSGMSENGLETAFASRYANVSALFWIGLLVAIAILSAPWAAAARRRATWAAAMAILLIGVGSTAMFYRGHANHVNRLQQAKRQPLLTYALRHHVHVEELYSTVSPWFGGFTRVASRLETLGHVPYDQPSEFPYASQIAEEDLHRVPKRRLQGQIDRQQLRDGNWLLDGWVRVHNLGRVRRVLLLDGERRVRGFGVPGFESPGALERTGQARWRGLARPEHGERLGLWAQVEDHPGLVRIRGARFDAPQP